MIKYIHGSEDSIDVDVYYVFETLPSFRECQVFCSADKSENRNIITIKDGIVSECFKGTVDEINNGLMITYPLHKQDHPLLVERKVDRDVLIKVIRVVRCLLSHCSRTEHREVVKQALTSNSWNERLRVLSAIDFSSITDYGKNGSIEDVYKVFAFQMGQCIGLLEKEELYTKSKIATSFPQLKKFLYRNEVTPEVRQNMNSCIKAFLCLILIDINVVENGDMCNFPQFHKWFDLKNEKYITN